MFSLNFENDWAGLQRMFKENISDTEQVTTATVSNYAPFAKYLHKRKGYFVLNDQKAHEYVMAELRKAPGRVYEKEVVARALERGIVRYISWLRSYVGTARTSFRGQARPGHPGNWGDITGFLNNAYRYRIDAGEWITRPEWRTGLKRAERRLNDLFPNSTRRK